MAFTQAPKPQTAPAANTTGISMSVLIAGKSKRSTTRFTLTADAQKRLFGRALNPDTDRMDVLIGRGQDEGRAQAAMSAKRTGG